MTKALIAFVTTAVLLTVIVCICAGCTNAQLDRAGDTVTRVGLAATQPVVVPGTQGQITLSTGAAGGTIAAIGVLAGLLIKSFKRREPGQ